MQVAITGSSGLIGSALRRSLEADGHRVVRVVRHASGGAPSDDQVIPWDPEQGVLDAERFADVDAVVHLAGEGIATRRWNAEQKRRIRESRTKGTALLASALASSARGSTRLLSGSAIGIYGDRGDQVLTEQSAPGQGFLAEVVVDWEAAAAPAVEAGLSVAFLRTGIVLDANGGALAKMLPLFRFGLGGKMGSGRQYWSWISLDDEVGAIRFLLEHPEVTGPVNLTGPVPVTNGELTAALGKALHRPALLPVPPFGPKLLLGGELAKELLFTSARVVPAALDLAGYRFQHRDVAAALGAVLA